MNSLSIQTQYNSAQDLNTNLVGGLQRAGINSTVSTAINGDSLEHNLKQNLGAEALNVTTAKLANEIGANQDDLGEVGHKAAHATLGCANAKVQGKDCASGAVGAVAGEMIAQQVGQNPNEPIRLTGHSHSGNVQKLVEQGHQNIIDDMLFLAAPVRKDYQTNNTALIPEAKLLNVYDRSDMVQAPLGGVDNIGLTPKDRENFPAKQTIDNKSKSKQY